MNNIQQKRGVLGSQWSV